MADREFTKTTNRELVGRCAEAGPEDPAWPEFFARFHGRLRLVVYRALRTYRARCFDLDLGSTDALVEDLVQETYVKLLSGERRALHAFEGKSENSFYTYLSAIAVNVTRDHLKKLGAQRTPRAALSIDARLSDPKGSGTGPRLGDAVPSRGPDPEEAQQREDFRRRAETAVRSAARAGAGGRDLLIFRLYFVEGFTIEEIAACAGVELTAPGVDKCIRRLRDILKKNLDSESLEGGWRRKYRL